MAKPTKPNSESLRARFVACYRSAPNVAALARQIGTSRQTCYALAREMGLQLSRAGVTLSKHNKTGAI